jgi:hypothetical protein
LVSPPFDISNISFLQKHLPILSKNIAEIEPLPRHVFYLFAFSATQIILVWYIRRSIKKSFHHHRLHEIVTVIEKADILSRTLKKDLFMD